MAKRITVKWTNELMVYDDEVDDQYLSSNAEIYQAKILGRTGK